MSKRDTILLVILWAAAATAVTASVGIAYVQLLAPELEQPVDENAALKTAISEQGAAVEPMATVGIMRRQDAPASYMPEDADAWRAIRVSD